MKSEDVIRIAIDAINAVISLADGLGQRDAVLASLEAAPIAVTQAFTASP